MANKYTWTGLPAAQAESIAAARAQEEARRVIGTQLPDLAMVNALLAEVAAPFAGAGQVVSVFEFMSAAEIADVQLFEARTLDVSASVQRAFDAVSASSSYRTKNVLYFPPGWYGISTSINVPAGLTMRCAGRDSTRFAFSGSGRCFQSVSQSQSLFNTSMRDFAIEMSSPTATGIYLEDQKLLTLEDINIEGPGTAGNTNKGVVLYAQTQAGFYNSLTRVWTNHCQIGFQVDGSHALVGAGPGHADTAQHTFIDCKAYGDSVTASRGWEFGVNAQGPNVIVGGYVEAAEYGVHVQGGPVYISGGWEAENCGTAKVRFAAGSYGSSYVQGHGIQRTGVLGVSDSSGTGLNKIIYEDATGTPAVAFPATQVSNSDPTTLDDYKEGTWTPAIDRLTTGVTTTYTSRTGTYTKIGRQVTITAKIVIGTISAAGSGFNRITGLPFPVSADGAGSAIFQSALTATACSNVLVSTNNEMYPIAASLAAPGVNENWVNGGTIFITATYFTAT